MNREPIDITAEMVAKGVLATCSMGDGGAQEGVDTSTVVTILVAAHDAQITAYERARLAVAADQLLRLRTL